MLEKFASPLIWGSGFGALAHLGFEEKRPQCLNKKNTKRWGTNRSGLNVKLVRIAMALTQNYSGVHEKLPRRALQITMARNNTTKNILQIWRKEEDTISFYSLEYFLSSFAAEPIRIAKSSLVAFERSLSSFEAKPIRNATPCLVAFEHILGSFAAKPIRIDNLTLLPRDVCG